MDGNGRWARRRGHPASFGHRAGVRAIKVVLQGCEDLGVKVLSVYAFSTENWSRPRAEVRALMRLFHETMQREIEEMHRRGVRIVVSGRRDELSPKMRQRIDEAMARTAGNTNGVLNVCLNYGGRAELVDAVRRVVADGMPAGRGRRGDDRRAPVRPRAPRARPHHPDRRRAPGQQLPALAVGLLGDARHGHAVAGLRRRRPQGRAG